MNLLHSVFKETRVQPNIWKRFVWLVGVYVLGIFYVWAYSTLASELTNIEKEYQWILMLLVPILREMSIWTNLKACSKSAEGSIPQKMTINHYYETRYAVFISIALGSIATTESSYCLIAIDFLTNIYHGLKIIKKSKAGNEGL